MAVVRIDALCECEGCSKRFGIDLDLASELNAALDFEDLVRKTITGGQADFYTWGIRGKKTIDRFPLTGFPSIQANFMLCDECTKKCDAFPIEGNLNREQVRDALNLPNEE